MENKLKKWGQSNKSCMWIPNRNIGHCWLVVLAIKFHPAMQFAAIASSISKYYEEKKKREKEGDANQHNEVLFC